MTHGSPLALLGGAPAFARPVGTTLNLPPWDDLEAAFRGIFERRYFANNGPLVQELDGEIASRLGVPHAVCVTNESVGVMILAKALGLQGDVLMPALAPAHTAQALRFAGLRPVFCDVDERGMLAAQEAERMLTPSTSAIAGVHLWGRACDPEGLQHLAERRGIRLLFDATQAMGAAYERRKVGTLGAGEVFSFHVSTVLDGAEGGCITTNDDRLAEKLRTIRNFSANQTFVPVPLRINGKMSEAQAALALLGLETLPANIAENEMRYEAYETCVAGLPGFALLGGAPEANFHYPVLQVDEAAAGIGRDDLKAALAAENVVATIPDRSGRARGADQIWERSLQLPTGGGVSLDDVAAICLRLAQIGANADLVRERVREPA